jgi:hypothetical protein
MSRWKTDAVALACILAGGAAGAAVTMAALQRPEAAPAVACAEEGSTAPRITVAIAGADGPTTAVVKTRRSCLALAPVAIHESRLRAAEEARLHMEQAQHQLERTSQVLELRSLDLDRELRSQLELTLRELETVEVREREIRQRLREKR